MSFLLAIGIILLTAGGMEALAWTLHKYVLHGPLWFLHKSHHRVNDTWWEWNDLVSLGYALAAAVLIIWGKEYVPELLWVGVGITVYGFFYFFLHDIVIHRRIKFRRKFKNTYMLRLIRAHKIHHKHLEKNPGEAYGFLFATKKYQPK